MQTGGGFQLPVAHSIDRFRGKSAREVTELAILMPAVVWLDLV
jgi:hypothetical protein